MIAIVASLLLVAQTEAGLSLADLPGYKAALDGGDRSPAVPVQFRDLWDRPKDYQGRRVRIKGRIVRRFRASPSGELPARVELWLATASNDILCVVFPHDPSGRDHFREDDAVAMEGTSLGLVRYEGGDLQRQAPLVVGPAPPSRIAGKSPASPTGQGRGMDWIIAGIAAAVVALTLARAHLRRPPRARIETGPSLEFEDEAPASSP